ncbi:Uncharacterised protein [Chlamydia trachomatis]|nr:Uncharacterised protein [Chlamydia trachomatis]
MIKELAIINGLIPDDDNTVDNLNDYFDVVNHDLVSRNLVKYNLEDGDLMFIGRKKELTKLEQFN